MQDANPPFFLGVDVGGTGIKIGLVDDAGRPVLLDEAANRRVASIKTDQNPLLAAEHIAAETRNVLERLQVNKSQCHALGLGVPGTMDSATRKLRQLPNLHHWENFPICDAISQALDVPVTFCNDANAAAYGEYWVGSAAGKHSLALFTLGTGIGCGIIIEGRSIDGASGYGGECGHSVIDCRDDAMLCGCGKRGHLEAYASATGLARRTIALTNVRESSLRTKITPETRLGEIPKIVYSEARNGDPMALEIIMDTAKYLSFGIVSVLHTVEPACVLLGGAMTFGGPNCPLGQRFLDQVTSEIKNRVFKAIADSVTIDFATLGTDAGFIGAAGLARAEYRNTVN